LHQEPVSPPLVPGRIFELRDGTKVRLRSIGRDDREDLLLGFEQLSPESRYQRFFGPLPHLPAHLIDDLLDTDDHNHIAIGAELLELAVDGRGFVGVARFVRVAREQDWAEIAVAVVDEFQRRGLGTLLLDELIRLARGVGVRRFRAYILPENRAVRTLLQELGFRTLGGADAGTLIFEIP